ncbi:hypothetical protein BH11PLA2_BH11PLA2_16240 [soil metagenome]
MKTFNTQDNIGTIKYAVNYHDGVKTHSDGSRFFDIKLFSNKKMRDIFCDGLLKQGYVRK